MDETIKTYHIDTRLESYRNFLSGDWGQELAALVSGVKRLDTIAFDLMAEWRGAAYVVSFPTQMIEHFRAFADSYTRTPNSDAILRFADVALERLSQRVPALTHRPKLRRSLQAEIVTVAAEMRDAKAKANVSFPIDLIWKQYLSHHVYQITLWSSLRICYVAIYNAYDNFVHQCVSTVLGESVRTTYREFEQKFRNAFDSEAVVKCWTDNRIEDARLVRHALSHAGGRPTPKLQNREASVHIADGLIHIYPEHVKQLYSVLKDAALTLCMLAKGKQQFY